VTCVALVAIHFWWRRKFLYLERQSRFDVDALQERLQQHALDVQTQQSALFDSMIEGLLLLDVNNRVKLANRAFVDMFEITVDVRGKTILEVLRQHELTELLEKVAREKQVHDYELKQTGLHELRAQVPTTAIALLALEPLRDHPVVMRGRAQLATRRSDERSGLSLSLAQIALGRFGERHLDLQATLEDVWARSEFLGNVATIADAR